MDKFYTPEDVAQIFGVSVRTIINLCNAGKLEYLPVAGRRRRFTDTHLQRFVERQTRNTTRNATNSVEKRQPSSQSPIDTSTADKISLNQEPKSKSKTEQSGTNRKALLKEVRSLCR